MRHLATILILAAATMASANGFRILQGHGGPVMGLASDGEARVLSASFDYSIGYWNGGAPEWLEGHRAAANTVAFLGPDRAVSSGDDFIVRVWDLATGTETLTLEGHTGKVLSVKVSPDASMIASASWDKTVRLWDADTGAPIRVLEGHRGNVNDVVFAQGGRALYSAGHDGEILEWDVESGTVTRTMVRHGFGINRLLVDEDAGWIAYGALDGGTRAIAIADSAVLADLTLDRRPILALAERPGGGQIAVGDGEGYVMVVDTADWSIHRDFRAAKHGPVWALTYLDGGDSIAAAGISDSIYVFPIDGGDTAAQMAELKRQFHVDPSEVGNGERQFLRKCSVCHTLGTDGARRAGPSLHGLFGRPAGSLEGYAYSPAMQQADIVWNEDTIDKLFDLGPDHYTPGSKMPMQRITSPQDRADLIAFLKRMTAPAPGQGETR